MKQIMKAGHFAYHVSGGYTERTKTYNINLYSTMDNSKNGAEPQRVNQLNLTASEFDEYINQLANIRLSLYQPVIPD